MSSRWRRLAGPILPGEIAALADLEHAAQTMDGGFLFRRIDKREPLSAVVTGTGDICDNLTQCSDRHIGRRGKVRSDGISLRQLFYEADGSESEKFRLARGRSISTLSIYILNLFFSNDQRL
jgi:hypothetical protein